MKDTRRYATSTIDVRESIELVVPSTDILEREVERYGVELDDYERNQVMCSLERVYYIILLFKELQNYFGDRIQFGGGSILNYIFISSRGIVPRFTFDLDSHWNLPVSTKRELLVEMVMFNKYLAEKYPVCIPIDEVRCVELMRVEYDVERNHFPEILSLRIPVLTRWTGEPFYQYVRRTTRRSIKYMVLSELRELFQYSMGVRDPKVDYVRFEISFGYSIPYRRYSIDLPFKLGSLNENITELEYQLASKIVYRVGRGYGSNILPGLHDVLKAVLDLRLLPYTNRERVRDYINMFLSREGKSLNEVKQYAKRNLRELLRNGARYWGTHHYILVRKKHTLGEVVENTHQYINEILVS